MVAFSTLAVMALVSFAAGLVDICLGMGYGFTVTPVLLLMRFTPLEAVPAVLFSSFVSAIVSSFFHERFGNVDFDVKGEAFRIAATIGVLGIAGGLIGARVALGISEFVLSLYIGLLVTASGVFVLASRSLDLGFSWNKIMAISLLGAFNKGLSGSGFGPIITTGGLLSGLDEKATVSIQALSEFPVSLAAFLTFLYSGVSIDWGLPLALTAGVVCAAPLAALVVQRVNPERLRIMIGVAAIGVGLTTLISLYL
jgi:uncharacterized membrane protein YfcA